MHPDGHADAGQGNLSHLHKHWNAALLLVPWWRVISWTCNFSVVGTPTDKNIVWRVESANVMITKNDLDTGSATNPQSYAYVHQLDDTQSVEKPTGTAVAGQILGKKLGGKNEVQNLFPASALYQPDYQALETEIYNCLDNGYASKAYLEWKFFYQTSTNLRPFKITYHAHFTAATGATSTCTNIEKIILN